MTEETLDKLTINYLTEEQYKAAKENNEINENELYCTPDDESNISNTYSTEEQVIGKWIDGKPLYRKVLQFTDTVNSTAHLEKPHGISNVETIWIDTSNSFLKAGNSTFPLPQVCYYGNFTDRVGMHVNTENILMYSETGWASNWTKVVTLNYTKTTD